MKLGTKAETLKKIKPYLTNSHVPFFIIFNQIKLRNELNTVINKILYNFPNQDIIIRSSSIYEDNENESKADSDSIQVESEVVKEEQESVSEED